MCRKGDSNGKNKTEWNIKETTKNIMCGVLSCVLVLGAVLLMPGMGITAKADDITFDDGGIRYILNSDGTASVKEAIHRDTIGPEVHIPAKIKPNGIDEYEVVKIESSAFSGCTNINKIILEEVIQTINDKAFKNTKITEIEIPTSVNKIKKRAFEDCIELKKIRFKGNTPPKVDNDWLASTGPVIEIPEGAKIDEWEKALKLNKYSYNFIIQFYDPTASSSTSSTTSTSSPNQEKSSNGEVEFIEEEPVNRIPEHVCQYEWEVVREVGADQDGLEQYLCKLCGNVQSTLTIPASQYQVQELYTKVMRAADGETVTYDTGLIHTVCDKLFTKLQERKDITLVITYQYKGENYRTTFPSGADYTELMQDTDQFYGMLGLNGRCGIVTEKN